MSNDTLPATAELIDHVHLNIADGGFGVGILRALSGLPVLVIDLSVFGHTSQMTVMPSKVGLKALADLFAKAAATEFGEDYCYAAGRHYGKECGGCESSNIEGVPMGLKPGEPGAEEPAPVADLDFGPPVPNPASPPDLPTFDQENVQL